MLNIEKNTRWVLTAIILVAVLGYVFSSFGNANAVLWTNAIFGVLLGIALYTESAIVEYFRQKKYKNIGFGDVFVFLGIAFGTIVIVNSIFIIQSVRNSAPEWLLSFLSINGAIAGGIAGILLLAMLWLPKPE